jgi:hypothetical protein
MFIHTYTQQKDWRDTSTSWKVAAFLVSKEHRREITRWCYKTFGAPGMNHLTKQIRWKDSIQYGEVYFSNQKDLEWFVLRWE